MASKDWSKQKPILWGRLETDFAGACSNQASVDFFFSPTATSYDNHMGSGVHASQPCAGARTWLVAVELHQQTLKADV